MIASLVTQRRPGAGRGGRRRVRTVLATLAGAGLAAVLTAGSASASVMSPGSASAGVASAGSKTAGTAAAAQVTPPPPAPGVAPSTAVAETNVMLFYTATDGSVWLRNLTNRQYSTAGGRLVGAPSAIAEGTSIFVFGRGTDNQLWVNACNLSGSCGSWMPLGGTLTSKPGAVLRGTGVADYSVYARGADGAVWGRDHSSSGWSAWHSLGGQLLAGLGPSAAQLGGTYVLVVGTNHQLYITEAGVTGFTPAGGQTTASPALTAIGSVNGTPPALIGFARGTDNVGYYHRFLSTSPGWHTMGGRLTSGLAVSTQSAAIAPTPTTFTFGLGTDNRIYENAGTWGLYPPSFTGWGLAS